MAGAEPAYKSISNGGSASLSASLHWDRPARFRLADRLAHADSHDRLADRLASIVASKSASDRLAIFFNF